MKDQNKDEKEFYVDKKDLIISYYEFFILFWLNVVMAFISIKQIYMYEKQYCFIFCFIMNLYAMFCLSSFAYIRTSIEEIFKVYFDEENK